MDERVKALWLEALKSDKYAKGKFSLRVCKRQYDKDGNPIREPLLDEDGKQRMDEDGKPMWGKAVYSYSFCCLGVLTDLYREENGGEWHFSIFDKASAYLSLKVAAWAGIPENKLKMWYEGACCDILIDHPKTQYLAELNDKTPNWDETIRVITEQL